MSSTTVSDPRCPPYERLPFLKPSLPLLDDVLRAYDAVYKSGQITNGRLVARLEDAVAERLKVRHCVAVSSCTSGLILVIKALGLTGEVILPSFTFFATGHAVLWNGLRPVFADCDPSTWNLDAKDAASRITERTTAIIAVHLYGNPAEVEALQEIAAKHRLKLIFDAAHAFGSARRGTPIGSFGDAEVFSLSPTKLLVGGEGGLICTDDAVLARLLRAARNYGDTGTYDPVLVGLNARMSEFNAALALAGLELVEKKVKRHNEIATRYTQMLASAPGVLVQHVESADTCAYKDYSVLIDSSMFGRDRDEVADTLWRQNIHTKKYFFPPLHQQKQFSEYDAETELVVTDRISREVLSLPIYESLPSDVVEYVAASIRRLAQPVYIGS